MNNEKEEENQNDKANLQKEMMCLQNNINEDEHEQKN